MTSDLQAFYGELYTVDDPERAQFLGGWRALGAANKAAHVARLTSGLPARRIVEIGCGDGALLKALSDRGVGETLDGFELSAEAAELARDEATSPRSAGSRPTTGCTCPPRTTRTTWRCSRTSSSMCPSRRRCCWRRRGWRRT